MSEFLQRAADELSARMNDASFDGTAKFVVGDAGAIMLDETGARVGNDDADVTLTADAETFQSIIEGDMNPTSAFMSGKLSVDGDMGLAMKLASALA